MDPQEQVERAQNFLQEVYEKELYNLNNKGSYTLSISFQKLAELDHELADSLLELPDEIIRAFELAIENIIENKDFKARFKDLSKSQEIMIRNIRSNHINKLMFLEGIVRQSSDVRPQVTAARFECPACGNTLSILQIENRFKEPSRCTCGRRGKFRMISKELVDAQRLVVEESPEDLEGGEQPKRLSIFLREDLVEPKMERKTTPGSKIRVVGVVREVPVMLKTGAQSTRYDLMMDANHIEPIEELFEDISLSEEDEKKIKTLAADPYIYEKFTHSIAPSIYGHDKVKEAIVYQLMGGVQKIRNDGTKTRGDMHVLLVGDPGCIAGESQVALIYKGMEQIKNLGQYHGQLIKEAVAKIRKNGKDKYYDYATMFHYYQQQPVLKLVTETGKNVTCTYNQPFLTKDGWKRADEIPTGAKIRVMPKIPTMVKKLASTEFKRIKKTYGPLKQVALPEKVTPELASLYGYIIGDGNIHPKGYRVTCYINDEETDIIDKLAYFIKDSFNIEPSVFSKEKEETKTIDDGNGLLRQFVSKQKMHILEINSKQVAYVLVALSSKRVPQQIFKSPLHVVSRFISWLFEADGCAFGKGRGKTSIQLKSNTPELLQDVQLLLLYFGIQSRIINNNLCIRRAYDMELFIKYIGFNSKKKQEAINDVISVINKRSQKRKKFQKWEKITEVSPAGIINVYDFEVPKSKRFIANGIVCHNSGKSQLLTFVSKVAPKARYVAGKGASLDYNESLLIKDSEGVKLVKIGDFVESNSNLNEQFVDLKQHIETLSLNLKTKKLEWKKIKSTYKHKNNEKLLKFELESGRNITVTKDHSIFILEDGKTITKNADNLKVKDCVLIPSKMQGFYEKYLDQDLARLLGYYIDLNGDGFGDIIVSHNDRVSVVNRTLLKNSTIPYLLKNITKTLQTQIC